MASPVRMVRFTRTVTGKKIYHKLKNKWLCNNMQEQYCILQKYRKSFTFLEKRYKVLWQITNIISMEPVYNAKDTFIYNLHKITVNQK